MTEIKGKYNSAVVYTDCVEESAYVQIENMCNQPFFADSKIRIMPDVHAGAGCTIGTTMTVTDKIVPNLVGVDIGCGIETVKLDCKYIEPEKLDKIIYRNIPSGKKIRKKTHDFADDIDLDELICCKSVNTLRGYQSIGTLGGGNHFIEVDKDDEGNIYLCVHSGSRNIGLQVANYYQNEAVKYCREKGIQIEKALSYLEGQLMQDYLHDMKIMQRYASINRMAMVDVILRGLNVKAVESFSTIHNYIDMDNMILRKGAVSAEEGKKLIIPINMRDGSLICVGKGSEEWNFSAPHGAGRLFGRKAAREKFTMQEFKDSMQGIFTTSVHKDTLDECPMAYKSMDAITDHIAPTADIVNVIKPVYNFKAGE